jgi:hypothetical protein
MALDPTTIAQTLLDGLMTGSPDKVRSIFSGPADIDDPFAGRHIDGGFETMVKTWGPAHIAPVKSAKLDRVTVGKEGRFYGAEYSLVLDKGGDKLVNAVAVIEMDEKGAKKTRLYYRRARIDGVQHVRNRILDESLGLEPYQPALQAYQDALTGGDANAQADTFSPDGRLDGHGEHTDMTLGHGMGIYEGRETIRAALVQMFGIIDHDAGGSDSGQHGANLEKLNGFTDGTNYVLEFNIIDPNHPTNRIHAGVAVYEIGDDGLIKEARVFDEAW